MRKIYKKIACAAICAATAATLAFAPACSGYYNKIDLDGDYASGDVVSNGGFVVQKGNYVYFVNGVADYTDDNTYGDVVKGAIMRISTSDLEAGNYSYAETVVPQIYYSGSYDTGIYIYGNKIYYSTPSTEVNSDGEVQNSYLEFKSANLDGSNAMKGYYYQSSSNSIEYRYVQIDGTVYLLYVASESYYETDDSCTNLHSVNCSTGEDTLLAYDISSYTFDESDATSGVVYYTMAVTDGLGGDNEISMTYNQIWRVEADATSADNVAADYDFSYIEWDDDEDEYPVYTNCGELVLDGIGRINGQYYDTQYNEYGKATTSEIAAHYEAIDHPDYTYALTSFKDGTLYYTITATATMLYTLDDSTVMNSGDSLTRNPSTDDAYLIDGDSVSNYTFIDVDGTVKALYTENYRLMLGEITGGEVKNGYCITPYSSDSEPSLIFTDDTYLYYAISGDNDTAIYRVDYTGAASDYNTLSTDSAYNDYKGVKVLDIEYNSSWFIPEVIDNHLFFASQTDEMGSYGYIMCCDLTSEETGKMMTNAEINELNEQYEDLLDTLDNIDEDEFANLTNALYYLFYTGDEDYLDDLINAYVEIEDMDEEYLYSKESAQIYHDFAQAVDGEMSWASYAENSKNVNGETVNSNMRDYYYSVIGEMTEDDEEDYIDALKAAYMEDYPEDTSTWWDNLNLAAKICFIAGMCVAGLILIAAIILLIVGLVKHHNKKRGDDEPDDRLEVDITDDKSIDVYEDEDGEVYETDDDDGGEAE